tara:strand:+ start:5880 stop:6158 length:279 start_codon:yes stop_codon:yes gene_type:complete
MTIKRILCVLTIGFMSSGCAYIHSDCNAIRLSSEVAMQSLELGDEERAVALEAIDVIEVAIDGEMAAGGDSTDVVLESFKCMVEGARIGLSD